MNRVNLVGRITRDPELRRSANGNAYVFFTVAVNRIMPNAQGERVADFINCVVFNKAAENLANFIRKGALLGIEGRLQTRSVQGQDGVNRTVMEVVCDNVSFLESKSQRDNNSQAYNDAPSQGNLNQDQQQGNYNQNNQNRSNNYNGYNNGYNPNNNNQQQNNQNNQVNSNDIIDDDFPF